MSREILTKIKELRTKERFIKPDEAWLRATRQTLLLRAQQALPPSSRSSNPGIVKEMLRAAFPAGMSQYVTRPIFAAMSLFMVLMGGSMMSVSASERSLPGDLLYGLKLVTEQARIVMASDKDEKLMLKTEFTGRRVDELRTFASDTNSDPQKVVDMAGVLKRDMGTLKQQLTEVSTESSPENAVKAAQAVDQQTNEVIVALQESKGNLSPESQGAVTDAQSAASETSVKAIEVLAVKHQEDGGLVSASDVADAIKVHAQIVTDVTSVPLPVDSTSTASGTTIVVITAPATSSTAPLAVALELGTSTGTSDEASNGTSTLPGILDQMKDATAQAFAILKVKDQQASDAFTASSTAATAPTSTTPIPPPDASTSTSTTTSTKP